MHSLYFAKQYSNNSLQIVKFFISFSLEKLLSQLVTLMLMVRKIRLAIIRFGRDSGNSANCQETINWDPFNLILDFY